MLKEEVNHCTELFSLPIVHLLEKSKACKQKLSKLNNKDNNKAC